MTYKSAVSSPVSQLTAGAITRTDGRTYEEVPNPPLNLSRPYHTRAYETIIDV